MKEIITCVKESFKALSNHDVKAGISIVSPAQIAKSTTLFATADSTLPSLSRIIKKNSTVAIVTSGENLQVLQDKAIANCRSLSLLGLQEYLVEPQVIKDLNLKYRETLNLGEIRDDSSRCEPLLRECEYVLIDIKSVKHSECELSQNPNGFKAEEISQVAHYIGCSMNLKGVIFYGAEKGAHPACYNLIAQMLWIISNSHIHNIVEDPADAYKKGENAANFQHKIVDFNNEGESIVFISSLQSGRIWMEIPIIKKNKVALVPCSEFDFQQAIDETIPNKWLVYYSKYNIL